MNCYRHPDRAAIVYCRTCGRALCEEDRREIYGLSYCADCATAAAGPAPPYMPPPGTGAAPDAAVPPLGFPNPGLALALGFIPGVGAIYNGQYFKAVLQVVIFGTLIVLSHGPGGPIFGIASAAFYFYMVIDSYRTARMLSLGQPVEDFPGLGHVQWRLPVGAVILIVLGTLLLLENLGVIFGDIWRFIGPALLIFFGVMLLRRRAH